MKPGFTRISSEPLSTAVVKIQDPSTLPAVLTELDLNQSRPTLALVGGASKLSAADYARIQSLFTTVLAPLAEKHSLYVVDGGTDAGVMKMMGEARAAISGQFPLIGVAPSGLVDLPNEPSPATDAATLEPHHTHCLLVPGSEWGDESPWLAETATQLAQNCASVVVLVNGGQVTWKDAQSHVDAQRPVVVIQGSGRTADIIAAALRGEPVQDERVLPLVASGLLRTVDLNAPQQELTQLLESLLRSH